MKIRRNNEESYEVVNVTLKNSNKERVQQDMEADVFNAMESGGRYNLLLSLT